MTDKSQVLLEAVKLHAAKAKKSKKSLMAECPSSILFPSLYLNSEQLPELTGKDVGNEITLVIKGKITSHSLRESTTADSKKADKRENFDIQIEKIGLVK